MTEINERDFDDVIRDLLSRAAADAPPPPAFPSESKVAPDRSGTARRRWAVTVATGLAAAATVMAVLVLNHDRPGSVEPAIVPPSNMEPVETVAPPETTDAVDTVPVVPDADVSTTSAIEFVPPPGTDSATSIDANSLIGRKVSFSDAPIGVRATWLVDDEDVGWDSGSGWCLADCALSVELVAPAGQQPAPTGQFDPSVLLLLGFTESDVRGRPIWAVLDALEVNWVVIETEFCTITTRDGVDVAAMQWDPLVDYPDADASTVAHAWGVDPSGTHFVETEITEMSCIAPD